MTWPEMFQVCAGWLDNAPVIGKCLINRTRGSETVAFQYEKEWLIQHAGLCLDPLLLKDSGRQYPPNGRSTFGFLSDIAPDRWGRRLMERRERIDAKAEGRSVRKLMESDYLLGVHDGGRTGGIRFKDPLTGQYLSDRQELAAPPIAQIRALQEAARHIEEDDPDEKWLRELLAPGTSLGGARPKANVVNVDGSMWIAKFPSRLDQSDIGAWEMVAHDLAVLCGIHVPEAMLEKYTSSGSTFLVKRFDREYEAGKQVRKHFASAMTMLCETDGSDEPVSYLDLLNVIEKTGKNRKQQAEELWKRLVFNICISNTDDHLRNHGFLLQPDDTWLLSPAYDLNPEPYPVHMSLLIDFDSDERDLRLALGTAEYYGITPSQAVEKIRNIQGQIQRNWGRIANRYHISREEQRKFADAFSETERTIG